MIVLATLEGIRAAAARIEGIARRTPVLDLSPLLLNHLRTDANKKRCSRFSTRSGKKQAGV